MITPDLLDYIKRQLEQGFSKEQIKNALLGSGWQEKDIEEAFYSILNPQPSSGIPQAPIPQAQTTQTNFSLLSATGLLKKSLDIYKQRFGVFIGIMIIPTIISIIFSLINQKIWGPKPELFLLKIITGENLGLFIFLFLLNLVFIFFLTSWSQAALVYAIKDSYEKIGIFEAYRRAWNKIFPYLWIFLLSEFIIFGGFIFLIIPGIIFAIWFSFGVFILISENLKGMDALLKSKEYIRGKFWTVFWYELILFILMSILAVVLSFILIIPLKIIGLSKESINYIIINIILIFSMPLFINYLFLLYNNLKTIKGEIPSSFKKSQKAIFVFFGVVSVLIIGIILFYFFSFIKSLTPQDIKEFQNRLNQKSQQNLFMSSTTMPSTSTSNSVSDPDIEKVKTILEDIKQGFITGDDSFIIKHSSKETAEFLSLATNTEKVKEFNVKNIFKDGEKIIADVIIVYLNGRPEQSYFVFVKQGDDWKFSLKDSFEYAVKQEIQNINVNSNPAGLPDLVVTGIDIYPSRPIVNDKNLEIIVHIKNIGDKTSEEGAPLEASLLGFKGSIPIAGGDLFPLAPGKETTWQFRPYSNNDFFKIKDTPGTKTIQIILNPGNKIKESNYNNNIFTQKIEVYSN